MTKITYKTLWKEKARNNLKDLPQTLSSKIEEKVDNYLVQAPKELGKPLAGKYSGLHRYRHGDYRIIYQIIEEENTIVILRVGHRKEVY